MANETNEDFLGDLKDGAENDPLTQEPDDPFASINQEESQPETGGESQEESEEKPLPFHKDPKVQRYIEREISKRIPEQKEEQTQDDYFDGVIQAFTEIVGNDTPQKVNALNALKDSLVNLDQRAAEKALSRLESAHQAEVAVEQEYENKLADGLEAIEDETGIDLYAPQNKKLRVKFIDFIEQVAPKENGEISELPDIGETFKAFQRIYRPTSQASRGKEIASRSMERSGGTVSQQQPSPGRLSWDNVTEKIRDNLGI